MAKDKKKNKKHHSLYKAIKPFIKDHRVLYSILGGVGAGVVLATVMGPEKSKALLDKITAAVTGFGQSKTVDKEKSKPAKKLKLPKTEKIDKPDKPKKPKKLFSKEDI